MRGWYRKMKRDNEWIGRWWERYKGREIVIDKYVNKNNREEWGSESKRDKVNKRGV